VSKSSDKKKYYLILLIRYRKQETFAETLFAAYLKGNVTSLAVGDLSLPEDACFTPFDVSHLLIPVSHPRLICVQACCTGGPSQSRRPVFGVRDGLPSRGLCGAHVSTPRLLTFSQVKTPVDDESTLLAELLNWSIRGAKTNGQRECAWHIVAAIVNKHSAGGERLFSMAHSPSYLHA
jgi:hypothetical protein